MFLPSVFQAAVEQLWEFSTVSPEYADVLSAPERATVEKIEDAGYERVGVGTDRIVFGLEDNVVMKLARPQHGQYDGSTANRAEANRWSVATGERKQLLAPITGTGADGRWVTMERAASVRGYEHELRADFKKRCGRCGVDLSADTLCWNVGYIESRGHDCFIDYAHNIW